MRFLFAALVTLAMLASAQADEEKGALLPFVGCVQVNSWGVQPAPKDDFERARRIDPGLAGRLAYYSVDGNDHLVAPRGWHCIEVRNENYDSTFIVSEEPYSLDDFHVRKPITGSAVVRFGIDGSINRLAVAVAASRYFPKIFPHMIARAAVKGLKPYPHDVALYRYDINHDVVYETPANREGLGTEDLLLVPGRLPIDTVLYIAGSEGDDPGLSKVAVRLPAGSKDLAIPILDEAGVPLFPEKFLSKP